MTLHIPTLSGQTVDFIARTGKTHTISGRFTSIDGAPAGGRVNPRNVRMHAVQFFLLPSRESGGQWLMPEKTWSPDNYYAGYDRLVAPDGRELQQEITLASATLANDLSFTLTWRETVAPDRSPYLPARRVLESAIDPNDPQLYRLTTVRRVIVILGHVQLRTAILGTVQPSPAPVFCEFWGSDTTRTLPAMAPHWTVTLDG